MALNQENRAKKHLWLRRAKAALGHARKVYVKTREQAKRAADTTEESTEEYAVEQTRQLLEDALRDSTEAVGGGTRAALRRGRQLYGKRKAVEEKTSPEAPQLQEEIPYEYTPTRSRDVLARDRGEAGNHPSTPTTRRTGGTRRANAQPLISQKPNTTSPKEKANVPKAAQTARRKAAYTAGRKAHRAKSARDKVATVSRATKNVLVSSVKAALDGAKALVAAVMAGGWVAMLVVVVICVIGMMVGSAYGIFFSGEDTGSGQTMQTVVREINEEYNARLDEIRASCDYDALEMSGSRAVWPEVLAVYAVKTTTDSENPQEVATITDEKKELLRELFWQMNEISSHTAVVTEWELIETDDGNGNIVEERVEVTKTRLYIAVSHKTAEEMAAQLSFDEDQQEQLQELLVPENASLWAAVLYGIGASDDQIVAVAMSQIGNEGGEPYWSWYGFESRVEWCACFVSWCANECGYIDTGVIPKFASCANGVSWFQQRGQWADNTAEPTPGMIIFFDWDDESGQDGQPDHVGIVARVENGRVYTIEGNSGDACKEKSYLVGYYEILGYGIPAY